MEQPKLFEVEDTVLNSILQGYNRTEESLNEDILVLKKWMKEQPHLPEILNDKSIQNFLIMNKFSIERAKQKIDMYYTMRTRIPEMCGPHEPDLANIKRVMEIVYYLTLPKLTKGNYKIFMFKTRNSEMTQHLNPYEFVKYAVNVLEELRLNEDIMFGDVVILDLNGLSLQFFKKVTPSWIAKCVNIYKDVWAMSLKGVYIVNSHPLVPKLLAIVKTLIEPKIFARFHVCQDTSILLERFPKNILPKDYGGDEKSLEEIYDMLKEKIRQYKDRFSQFHKLEVNEDLRPKNLENDEHLGFHGNFKTLNVD